MYNIRDECMYDVKVQRLYILNTHRTIHNLHNIGSCLVVLNAKDMML